MKYFLFVVTVLISGHLFAQYKVAGRWVEVERQAADGSPDQYQPLAIYIFNKDSTFYKGVETDGVLLFGVAGRYLVSGDSVQISFFDFVSRRPDNGKMRKMNMKILSITNSELRVEINESRYRKYTALLRRQTAEQ